MKPHGSDHRLCQGRNLRTLRAPLAPSSASFLHRGWRANLTVALVHACILVACMLALLHAGVWLHASNDAAMRRCRDAVMSDDCSRLRCAEPCRAVAVAVPRLQLGLPLSQLAVELRRLQRQAALCCTMLFCVARCCSVLSPVALCKRQWGKGLVGNGCAGIGKVGNGQVGNG